MSDEKAASPKLQAAPDALAAALRDSAIPRLYANGFTIGLTNADTHVVLQLFGRPIAVLNMSYTLAKTLAGSLEALVNDWEKRTGQPLVTTQTIDLAFKDLEGKEQ